eukprot:scpid61702/ scgid23963/ 
MHAERLGLRLRLERDHAGCGYACHALMQNSCLLYVHVHVRQWLDLEWLVAHRGMHNTECTDDDVTHDEAVHIRTKQADNVSMHARMPTQFLSRVQGFLRSERNASMSSKRILRGVVLV